LRLSNQLAIHDKTGLDNQSGFLRNRIEKEEPSRSTNLIKAPLLNNGALPSKSNALCTRTRHCHQNQI